MLNYISNWPLEDAKEIMKSFKNDPMNEGREVIFGSKSSKDNAKHWCVVIEDPHRSVYHPQEYKKSYRLPLNQRPKRIDWGIHSNGGLPPCCQDGCSPNCPREYTKKEKEIMLERGRERHKMEENAEAVRAMMDDSRNRSQKLKDRQDSVIPRSSAPRSSSHWLDTQDNSTRKDSATSPPTSLNPPDMSASPPLPTTIDPSKLRFTAAEWEKLEPPDLKPPPTPRPQHMQLPAAQENLEPIRPPPTPQLKHMGFYEWDKLNPIEPPSTPRPSPMALPISSDHDKQERDRLLMPPPPRPNACQRARLKADEVHKATTLSLKSNYVNSVDAQNQIHYQSIPEARAPYYADPLLSPPTSTVPLITRTPSPAPAGNFQGQSESLLNSPVHVIPLITRTPEQDDLDEEAEARRIQK
jgi:hypothetical protein